MEYTPNALEERLIDFGAAICKAVRRLPRDGSTVDTDRLTRECSELIAVFVSGINTAKAKSRRCQQRQPAGKSNLKSPIADLQSAIAMAPRVIPWCPRFRALLAKYEN